MLTMRLRKNGYDVITAPDGEECIKMAAGESPDLILLDILMPGMSGFEVCKRLKRDDFTKDIPVIMLTAMIGSDAEAKGVSDGAVSFISKPFDSEDLLAQIKSGIAKKSSAKKEIA